jgi:hypothetical protein
MRTNLAVNVSVKNQGVINVVRRPTWIERKYGVRVFSRVLKKILWNHSNFTQFLASLI